MDALDTALRLVESGFDMRFTDLDSSSAPTEELILFEQSRKLYEAWDKFRKRLPQDRRQGLDEQPPSMRYLFNSASINHQEIAEGVLTSLDELSQDIVFWNRQLSVYGDVTILHHYVKKLYVGVFKFLTEIFTKWSKSNFKRFLTSFHEKAVNELFTEKQRRIVAIERRMERETSLEFQRTMSDNIQRMAADQQELHQAVLNGPDYQANLILSLGTSFQRHFEQQTHPSQLQLSQDGITESDTQLPGAEIEASSPLAIEAPKPATVEVTPTALYSELNSQKPSEPRYLYHREDLLADLRTFSLQVGRDMQDIVQMTFRASHTAVNLQLQNHLLSWTKDTKPNRLWIQGPSGTSQPSQNRLTAVCLTALSRQNDIPYI
ncbi:hypothetical protein MMC17_009349 [Xylographa soralifera]|nr:hypothetical protein [Xylographa soralifera]